TERRQDQHLAVGYRVPQRRGGVETGATRHLDVQQRNVRLRVKRGVDHGITGADLGNDLDVRLEPEQQRERTAHHALVLGEQYPDHAFASVVTGDDAAAVMDSAAPMGSAAAMGAAGARGAAAVMGSGAPMGSAAAVMSAAAGGAAASEAVSSGLAGMVAMIWKPLPGALPKTSVPPAAATRSVSPISPAPTR